MRRGGLKPYSPLAKSGSAWSRGGAREGHRSRPPRNGSSGARRGSEQHPFSRCFLAPVPVVSRLSAGRRRTRRKSLDGSAEATKVPPPAAERWPRRSGRATSPIRSPGESVTGSPRSTAGGCRDENKVLTDTENRLRCSPPPPKGAGPRSSRARVLRQGSEGRVVSRKRQTVREKAG
jgi:hypothetical protein